MATGWARDGAVQDQIDDSIKDAVASARAGLPTGDTAMNCTGCGDPIPEKRSRGAAGRAPMCGMSGGPRCPAELFIDQSTRQQGQPASLALAAPAFAAYLRQMARPSSRSIDWGFPRWRGYGTSSAAVEVRLCDRHDCNEPGDRPAPKSPNSPERWYFCETHAGEYNRGWNYFEGLSAEDAAAREAEESGTASAFAAASHYGWGGPGDGTRSRDEMRALAVLELEADATFDDARASWRRLAKANHPDVKPGDKDSAERFQRIQAAWDVLRSAEERRAA